MSKQDDIIIGAMWQLSKDIQSEDGVANGACRQAANRLQLLHNALYSIKMSNSKTEMKQIAKKVLED